MKYMKKILVALLLLIIFLTIFSSVFQIKTLICVLNPHLQYFQTVEKFCLATHLNLRLYLIAFEVFCFSYLIIDFILGTRRKWWPNLSAQQRFAPRTLQKVDINQQKLLKQAEIFASEDLLSNSPVLSNDPGRRLKVLGLTGNMGEGKSTFFRASIESISDRKKYLYTYIALTETNSDDDLGKIFASRVHETIKERFHIPFLQRPTSEKAFTRLLNTEDSGIPKTLSALLGILNTALADGMNSFSFGAKKFYENRWIICFDEIERGNIKELLLLAEIVERLRFASENPASWHIPEITLVLCISNEKLRERLKDEINDQERDKKIILSDFFFSSTKTFDYIYRIPPTEKEDRFEYVKRKIFQISETFQWSITNDYSLVKQFKKYDLKFSGVWYSSEEETALYTVLHLSEIPIRDLHSTIASVKSKLSFLKRDSLSLKDIIILTLLQKEFVLEFELIQDLANLTSTASFYELRNAYKKINGDDSRNQQFDDYLYALAQPANTDSASGARACKKIRIFIGVD